MTHSRTLLALTLLCAPATLTACDQGETSAAVAATHTATVDIAGMTCASCSVTVKAALGRVDGIASVDVDVEAGRAVVEYDQGLTSGQAITDAISATGYAATLATDDEV